MANFEKNGKNDTNFEHFTLDKIPIALNFK